MTRLLHAVGLVAVPITLVALAACSSTTGGTKADLALSSPTATAAANPITKVDFDVSSLSMGTSTVQGLSGTGTVKTTNGYTYSADVAASGYVISEDSTQSTPGNTKISATYHETITATNTTTGHDAPSRAVAIIPIWESSAAVCNSEFSYGIRGFNGANYCAPSFVLTPQGDRWTAGTPVDLSDEFTVTASVTDAEAKKVRPSMAQPAAWVAVADGNAGSSSTCNTNMYGVIWSSIDIGCGVSVGAPKPTGGSKSTTAAISATMVEAAAARIATVSAQPEPKTCPFGGDELFADSLYPSDPGDVSVTLYTDRVVCVGTGSIVEAQKAALSGSLTEFLTDHQGSIRADSKIPMTLSNEFQLAGGQSVVYCYNQADQACDFAWSSGSLVVIFSTGSDSKDMSVEQRLAATAKWGAAHLATVVTAASQA